LLTAQDVMLLAIYTNAYQKKIVANSTGCHVVGNNLINWAGVLLTAQDVMLLARFRATLKLFCQQHRMSCDQQEIR
ncbi:MAG: hypothetical protein ACKPKK_23540, partial [Dolichospermum sp.]